MERLIKELKQAIENFNLYLKNEYTTINNKLQGISNDISDYSVFTLNVAKAKDLKVPLTFPRATYIMVTIKGASSSTFIEASINQQTKEKLKFYDGSYHKGIIRDIYLTYDLSELDTMPEVKVYVGYNSSFNPITSVRLADVTSENPLPVNIIGNDTEETSQIISVISKQLELLLSDRAETRNQKLLSINATPKNALITVTIAGQTYTSKGFLNMFVDEDESVSYKITLDGYQTRSGTVTMDKNQSIDIQIYEPRSFRIYVTEPSSDVNIDITTPLGTTRYSQDTGTLIFNKGEQISYVISDANEYDPSEVGADGYASKSGSLILDEDTFISEQLIPSYTIKFELSGSALPYGSDRITVVDEDNLIITGATINIRDNNDNSLIKSYITDENGQAEISELAHIYKIEVSKQGYTTYHGIIEIEKNVDKQETITI